MLIKANAFSLLKGRDTLNIGKMFGTMLRLSVRHDVDTETSFDGGAHASIRSSQLKIVKRQLAAISLGFFAAASAPGINLVDRSDSSFLTPQAARAINLEEANSKLSNYGFPPMLYVPQGFSPLVSEYGRGNIKEAMSNPVLVRGRECGQYWFRLTMSLLVQNV